MMIFKHWWARFFAILFLAMALSSIWGWAYYSVFPDVEATKDGLGYIFGTYVVPMVIGLYAGWNVDKIFYGIVQKLTEFLDSPEDSQPQ